MIREWRGNFQVKRHNWDKLRGAMSPRHPSEMTAKCARGRAAIWLAGKEEREREKENEKTLNPCKKEERMSSTLIPEINDFMLSLRRVIVGVLVSLFLFFFSFWLAISPDAAIHDEKKERKMKKKPVLRQCDTRASKVHRMLFLSFRALDALTVLADDKMRAEVIL